MVLSSRQMPTCFPPRERRAGCSLLASVLLLLLLLLLLKIPQWAVGAPEGNGTTLRAGHPLLLPASGNRPGLPVSIPRVSPAGENTSRCRRPGQEQQGSPQANSSASLLAVSSLPVELEVSFQISAAGLIFAAFSGCGITMPFCHPQKLRIRGKAWIWLGIYANGLAGLACAMALAALVLWSYDQGFPAVLIAPIILLIHVMAVTLLIVVTIVFQLEVLHQVTDQRVQRMLDLTAPGGVILVIVVLSLLMKHICKVQEERCIRPMSLTAVVAGAAGMCLLPFLTILAAYCLDVKRETMKAPGFMREKRREASLQRGKPSGHPHPHPGLALDLQDPQEGKTFLL